MSEASSSAWRLQISNEGDVAASVEEVLRSSCPPDDDVGRLQPLQASKNDRVGDGDGEGGTTTNRVVYAYAPPELCSSLLAQPPNEFNDDQSPPLRVILAMHGYGGQAVQEIHKWRDAAAALDAMILAPEGTMTPSEERLGWNAVECCGDPVVNEVDDVDFILNGAVEPFLKALEHRGDDGGDGGDGLKEWRQGGYNVIATGFSNGGFMSSLLGLLHGDGRPPWLAGIVPTGGYQYDMKLYGGARPLPVMSHHGGQDSTVDPEGCCASSADGQSNCLFGIGVDRMTCTSAKFAFEMWTAINKCTNYKLDTPANDRRLSELAFTCYVGMECEEPTEFCSWNNEGHSWGMEFPGMHMARDWMAMVFDRAENWKSEVPWKSDHDKEESKGAEEIVEINHGGDFDKETVETDHGGNYDFSYAPPVTSYGNHPKKGRENFSATAAALVVLVLTVLFFTWRVARRSVGGGTKRKTGEEEFHLRNGEDRIGEKRIVVEVIEKPPSNFLCDAIEDTII